MAHRCLQTSCITGIVPLSTEAAPLESAPTLVAVSVAFVVAGGPSAACVSSLVAPAWQVLIVPVEAETRSELLVCGSRQ